jgi:hypothetical protein
MYEDESTVPVAVAYSSCDIVDAADFPEGNYELQFDGHKVLLTKKRRPLAGLRRVRIVLRLVTPEFLYFIDRTTLYSAEHSNPGARFPDLGRLAPNAEVQTPKEEECRVRWRLSRLCYDDSLQQGLDNGRYFPGAH